MVESGEWKPFFLSIFYRTPFLSSYLVLELLSGFLLLSHQWRFCLPSLPIAFFEGEERVNKLQRYLMNFLLGLTAGMTPQLLIMCSIRGLLADCFLLATCKLVMNSTDSPFDAWFFTDLSLSSLTNKLTYIQGKMIEEITIKFATELKLTQDS